MIQRTPDMVRDNDEKLAARNKRVAIIFGLLALSIYLGYILAYYF